ncbi:MerR family transcriptional regulator [Sphingomonas sp. ASV193]|uniref:MerR family transcriptional regulator n=1 Tax=Sphingomonas sp. ASV193 TaxID=3144405 RepID=UPI0032E8C3C4
MSLTIAQLAKGAGVGVETIRYYQRRGLLAVPEREAGSIRRYGQDDAARLGFIRSAQRAGFTLSQIAELIALDSTADRARARDMARERIAALDAEIAALKASRASLERLARDCADGPAGPCPILTAFEV